MAHGHARPLSTLLAALLIPPLLTTGCMSTKTRRLARFDTGGGASPVIRPAPASGVYKVKYAGPTGRDLRALGGTGRIVGQGEPIGFTAAEDGTVVAVAGDEQIPLDRLPPGARYCVWSFKAKRPTQFTREVGKATDTVGQAAAFAGGVALVGGLVVGHLYLDALTDEMERERCDDRDRRRRKPRGYRWVGAPPPDPQKPAPQPPTGQPKQEQ